MKRRWSLLLSLAFVSTGIGQTLPRQNLATILGFENSRAGAFPTGWSVWPSDAIFVDDQVVHSGKYSTRIERNEYSSEDFSTLGVCIPLDFEGKKVEWRGFFKTEKVNGFVALYLREDGTSTALAFDSLQRLNVHGTWDWRKDSVFISVVPGGKQLCFGFLLHGTGKGWVDDLSLLVDGRPVALAAPLREPVLSGLWNPAPPDHGANLVFRIPPRFRSLGSANCPR